MPETGFSKDPHELHRRPQRSGLDDLQFLQTAEGLEFFLVEDIHIPRVPAIRDVLVKVENIALTGQCLAFRPQVVNAGEMAGGVDLHPHETVLERDAFA